MKYLEIFEQDNYTENEYNLDETDPDFIIQNEKNEEYEKYTELLYDITNFCSTNGLILFTKLDICKIYDYDSLIKLPILINKQWYLIYSEKLKDIYENFKYCKKTKYKDYIKFAYICSNGYIQKELK